MSHLIEWVTNNNGSKNVLTVDSYFMLNEHVSHHTPAPLTVNNLLRHWIDTRDSQVRWNSKYFSVETYAIVAKSIKILLKPENLMTWHHPTELELCLADNVDSTSRARCRYCRKITEPLHSTKPLMCYIYSQPTALCRRLSMYLTGNIMMKTRVGDLFVTLLAFGGIT